MLLFNILVNAVVREWLRLVIGTEASAEWANGVQRRLLAVFYVDDDFVVSRDPDFLQEALDSLVSLFD